MTVNKYKIYWTDLAKIRLREIFQHIEQSNPRAAKQQVSKLLNRSTELSELPKLGRRVPEYLRDDIREILARPFRIIYRIKKNQIDILTVMHFHQDLDSATLKSLIAKNTKE